MGKVEDFVVGAAKGAAEQFVDKLNKQQPQQPAISESQGERNIADSVARALQSNSQHGGGGATNVVGMARVGQIHINIYGGNVYFNGLSPEACETKSPPPALGSLTHRWFTESQYQYQVEIELSPEIVSLIDAMVPKFIFGCISIIFAKEIKYYIQSLNYSPSLLKYMKYDSYTETSINKRLENLI